MSIVFYYAPRSSASPVASALYELDVPHKRVTFDLKESEHKKPGYLVINPNGKVPTLVVDDTPMFEAVAIMMWLGDRAAWPRARAPLRHPPPESLRRERSAGIVWALRKMQ